MVGLLPLLIRSRKTSSVDAVMSYLRASKRYDEMMEDFFSLLQIDNADHGAIGKLAEYIFASVSNRDLVETSGTRVTLTNDSMNYRNLTTSCRASISTLSQAIMSAPLVA